MILFDYPKFYEGELLYSLIERFHKLSGYDNLKDSIGHFYGYDRKIYSINFIQKVGDVINRLGISKSEYIECHTIFPFYKVFTKSEQYNRTIDSMLYTNAQYYKIFYTANGIKWDGMVVKYCPICLREIYSENIIIRDWQIDGVEICYIHGCYLNKIRKENRRNSTSIFSFDLNMQIKYPDKKDNYLLNYMAKSAHYILNTKLDFTIIDLRKSIRKLLSELGIMRNGRIYNSYNNVLMSYYSNVIRKYPLIFNDFSLEKISSVSIPNNIMPIHYFLVIGCFFNSIEEFFYLYKRT